MSQVSEELDALTCDLIGEAINILEMEGSLPVLLLTDAEEDLFAFEEDDPDGCYRAACQQVQDLGSSCNRYAIAYEGVVQGDEASSGSPAIVFEFAERGTGEAWSGFLLFHTTEDGALEVSDPQPAGAELPLFS